MKIEAKELEVESKEIIYGEPYVFEDTGLTVVAIKSDTETDDFFSGVVTEPDDTWQKWESGDRFRKSAFKLKREQQQEFKPIEVRMTLETELEKAIFDDCLDDMFNRDCIRNWVCVEDVLGSE